MGSLGAIYKPEIVCPCALNIMPAIKALFHTFSSRVSIQFRLPYFTTFTTVNFTFPMESLPYQVTWTGFSEVLTLSRKLCTPSLLTTHILVGLLQMER